MPLLRYTADVNGFDSLVMTKLDVLDGLDAIPVCVGYKLDGKLTGEMPASQNALARIEPVYETMPGWSTSTVGVTEFSQLPAKARDYVLFIQERTGVEIGCVSTGPERNQTMVLKGSRMEKLLGT